MSLDFSLWTESIAGLEPKEFVDNGDAEVLTVLWKARCPLYGTVAAATPDTTVTLVSHTETRR